MSDLDSHKLIEMALLRTHAEIKAVLELWGEDILSTIVEVSIDLSDNYRGLIRRRRLMPQAEIVADRFHAMKLVNYSVF